MRTRIMLGIAVMLLGSVGHAQDVTVHVTETSQQIGRGDEVLRVKGVIRTPAGRLLLQSVRKVMQSPEILPEQLDGLREDNKLVVIGSGYVAGDLVRSLTRFASVGKQ